MSDGNRNDGNRNDDDRNGRNINDGNRNDRNDRNKNDRNRNDRTNRIEEKLLDAKLTVDLNMYFQFWLFVVKKQWPLFVGYAVFLVAMASLTPIITLLWKRYIDLVNVGGPVFSAVFIICVYIAARIALDFCYFLSMRFMDYINCSSWRVLDASVNKKAAEIKNEFFEIPNIQNRIERAWEFNHGDYIQLYQMSFDLIRYAAQAIGIFVSLFIISPSICGIALITFIPTIISKLVGDKISILGKRNLADDENELEYYKNAIYDQALIKEITIKNAFDFFREKYEKKAAVLFQKKKILEMQKMKFLIFEEAAANAIILACFLFASYLLVRGEISLGGLAAVFTIILNLIYTLSELMKKACSMISVGYGIMQFYEFMDLDAGGPAHGKKAIGINKEPCCIDLANVSYRYPLTDKYVLNNINVSIKKGQHIAVVGANGSGKSTFIKLILRLLEPSVGEIRYNDTNLDITNCNEYWELFSTVFQDFGKYKESLRYNVSISNVADNRNDEKMKDVLRAVQFNKEVDMDCMLSKEFGGIELSGGEWQKIALARSIFKSNNIYILDEPTSAIDPVREMELYEHFAEMTKGKTSIFVTHRLGSVLYSDVVLFFKDGEIAEAGTHQELLAKQGLYFQFWNVQSKPYIKDL